MTGGVTTGVFTTGVFTTGVFTTGGVTTGVFITGGVTTGFGVEATLYLSSRYFQPSSLGDAVPNTFWTLARSSGVV
jgi:hypothetical protein